MSDRIATKLTIDDREEFLAGIDIILAGLTWPVRYSAGVTP